MRARIMLVTLALAASAAGSAGAEPPQVWNGRIAFTTSNGLASVNSDGSGVWTADLRVGDSDPAWSPDGSRLAFVTHSRSAGIVTVDPDGNGEVQLTNDYSDAAPAWSPDGTKIAFSQAGELWLMNADGSDQHQLTHQAVDGVGDASDPSWSPDGKKIAFSGFHETGKKDPWGNDVYNYDVFVLDLASGGETQLTTAEGYNWMPAWSPDGSKIAFASGREGPQELYLMNPDGSGQTRLLASTSYDGAPAWSPDGTQLAFARNNQVWIVDRNGGNAHAVATSDTLATPAWQPLGPPPVWFCDRWGTAADDVLVAGNGGETLCGEDGGDTLIGGAGTDRLVGGLGNDYLAGAQGFDILAGGPGDDTLDARDGHADTINGGSGANVAYVDRGLDNGTNAAAYASRNVAVWRPVTASAFEATSPPELAVDGRVDTLWNSGGYPTQWIEIDLQRPTRIAKLQLVGTDHPEGAFFFVLGRGPGTNGAYRLLHMFVGPSVDKQALTYVPNTPWRGIRYVRVVTPAVNGSGWVAWREIGVFAAAAKSGR